MDAPLWALAQPLQGGLKEGLLTVLLNLGTKGGAQTANTPRGEGSPCAVSNVFLRGCRKGGGRSPDCQRGTG